MYYVNKFFEVTQQEVMTTLEEMKLKQAGNYFDSREKAEELVRKIREEIAH